MNLLGLIVTLVILGVIMWAINTYIPMQEGIKNLMNIFVVIVVVLWLLAIVFGVSGLGNMSLPRVR